MYDAAQRQIGETALNERSSRSHQIIKLVLSLSLSLLLRNHLQQSLYFSANLAFEYYCPQTVESSAREFMNRESSATLSASVVRLLHGSSLDLFR